VGRQISSQQFQDELYSLASSPRDVFFTSDDDILNLVDHLDGILCPNITVTSSGNHDNEFLMSIIQGVVTRRLMTHTTDN
jgi:hypothetical protein